MRRPAARHPPPIEAVSTGERARPHRARRRFGQHFLHERGIIARIIACIDPRPGERLVEIGPGLGALTAPLLARADTLDVIELDRDLARRLSETFAAHAGLHVHVADALRFDFRALAGDGRRLRVVGNLPYNISTPLLFRLIEQARIIEDMHFMLQRELVERMAAGPGSRDYGRLSVMVGLACEVEKLLDVAPGAFRPAPEVRSAFVRLRTRREPPIRLHDRAVFADIVGRCFSRRRKTLRNCLRDVLSEPEIRALGIDPGVRPENLDLAAFGRLANAAASKHAGRIPDSH